MTTAESNISQNTNAITSKVSKTEVYNYGYKTNLSPFFDETPYTTDSGYWVEILNPNTTFTATYLGDGWCRIQRESGYASSWFYFTPKNSSFVTEDTLYTFLIEFKNINSSESFDLYTNNSQLSANTINLLNGFSNWSIAPGNYLFKRFTIRSQSEFPSSITNLISFRFASTNKRATDFAIRISLYEGEYYGPYCPMYSTYTEMKQTQSDITTIINSVNDTQTLIRQYDLGVLVSKTNQSIGALVNANGNFQIWEMNWNNGTPNVQGSSPVASFGQNIFLGKATQGQVVIRPNSFEIRDPSNSSSSSGSPFFMIQDLRDIDTQTKTFTRLFFFYYSEMINTSELEIKVEFPIYEVISVHLVINSSPSIYQSNVEYSISTEDSKVILIPTSQSIIQEKIEERSGAYIYIIYSSKDPLIKTLRFGSAYSTGDVSGAMSVSFGSSLRTTGNFSFGQGKFIQALGDYSYATGYNIYTKGDYSHAEGLSVATTGKASHAEGSGTIASGDYSHAEGFGILTESLVGGVGTVFHTEEATTASGNYSHAEGNATTASGESSHSEGGTTTASGNYSHAEGNATTASGESSHAEGSNTIAATANSHAGGSNTTTYQPNQTVIGQYNVIDTNSSVQKLFVIGNGDSNLRSDGLWVTSSGDLYVSGNIYDNEGILSNSLIPHDIAIKSSSIDRSYPTSSNSQENNRKIIFTDTNDKSLAQILITQKIIKNATNFVSFKISAFNETTDETEVQNNLELRVNKDGTRSVYVSDKSAWLTGIGAAAASHTHDYLPTSGGIVTGNIQITGSQFIAKSNNITSRTAVTSGTNGNSSYRFFDSGGTELGMINARFIKGGVQGVQMYTTRKVETIDKYNALALYLDASGNPTVTVTDPLAWRNALGINDYYLPLAGGTVTGDIVLKDPVIDRDAAVPTANQIGGVVQFQDKDGERLGQVEIDRLKSGLTQLRIGAFSENGGTEDQTWLDLQSDPDGDLDCITTGKTLILSKVKDLSGTADNRPALIVGGSPSQAHIEIDANEIQAKSNATTVAVLNLNTDGGGVNMGGGLTTHGIITAMDANIVQKRTTMDTTASSLSANAYSTFGTQDENGKYAGYISIYQTTSGDCRTSLASRRHNNNADFENVLILGTTPTGTRTVTVSAPAEWRTAIGAAASSHSHSYLPLSGGTVTGAVHYDSSNITFGTTPSSNTNGTANINFRDSKDVQVGYINTRFLSDGRTGLDIGVSRPVGSSTVYNAMDLLIDANGNRSVSVSDAAAWRSAIGAMPSTKTESSSASIFTVGSNVTVTSVYHVKTANVFTFTLQVKTTAKFTSGATNDLGYFASGYRPYGASFNAQTGNPQQGDGAWITTGGTVKYKAPHDIASGSTLYVSATYVVA